MFVNNSLKNKDKNNNYMTAHSKTAILDSGCTIHFTTNNAPCNITKENKPQLTVRIPNDETILYCNTAKLHLPTLNEQSRESHVSKDLNNNLLLVGQLCDDGYNIKFNKHKATVHKKSNIILTAKRDHSNGLWSAPLTDHTPEHNNVQPTAQCILAQSSTTSTKCYLRQYDNKNKSYMVCCHNIQDYTNITYVVSYLQGTIFTPVKTTIVQAINNGNFASWPGLTVKNVNKHHKRTIATAKGHMAQTSLCTLLLLK
jgi:hypothetical protein